MLEQGYVDSAAGPGPQGAGGLKFDCPKRHEGDELSRPARGGWIEMLRASSITARGGWIEILMARKPAITRTSRPARGGRIEIFPSRRSARQNRVPPRKGRVD